MLLAFRLAVVATIPASILGCHGPTKDLARTPRLEATEAPDVVVGSQSEFRADQSMLNGPPGRAIIYARKEVLNRNDIRWKVLWQPTGRLVPPRIVHQTAPTNLVFSEMPRDFGFVPSPDGTRLCLWEPSGYQEREATIPGGTSWRLITVPEGKTLDLGDSAPGLGYLPFWLNDTTLVLERGDDTVIYQVAKPAAAQQLGTPHALGVWDRRDVDRDDGSKEAIMAAEWRRAYIDGHYRKQAECLRSTLPRLGQALGLAAYLRPRDYPTPDTLDNMLLRPMGIVALWGYRDSKRCWPSVAVSEDCRLMARAGVLVTGSTTRISGTTGQREQANTMAVQLDAYDVPTGKRLWGTRMPWPYTVRDDVVVLPGGRGSGQWYTDLRWSPDARYLSFTHHDDAGQHDSVTVIDRAGWTEVVRIPNATNAFLIPWAE